MRWVGHVAVLGESRRVCRVLVGKLKDLGVDGRIILRWMFRKWSGEAWTGLIWLRAETGVNAVMNLRVP